MKTVVVSVRIPKELKEEADKLGIKLRSVLEKSLKEEIERRKKEILYKNLEMASKILKKVDIEEIVKDIREFRERK